MEQTSWKDTVQMGDVTLSNRVIMAALTSNVVILNFAYQQLCMLSITPRGQGLGSLSQSPLLGLPTEGLPSVGLSLQ